MADEPVRGSRGRLRHATATHDGVPVLGLHDDRATQGARLRLVQAVIQSPLAPALDDLLLSRFDPQTWAALAQEFAQSSRAGADVEEQRSKQKFDPRLHAPDAIGKETRRHANAAADESADKAAERSASTMGSVHSVQDPAQERLRVLSQVLLGYGDQTGSSNTRVNELRELALPPGSQLSQGNVARLLQISALHANLTELKSRFARMRWSDHAGKSSAQLENLTDRLRALIAATFPERCAGNSSFAEDLVVQAQAEGRELELVHTLTQQLASSCSPSGQAAGVSDGSGCIRSMPGFNPPSAFLSTMYLEMQLSSLECSLQVSSPIVARQLVMSTCDGILSLFREMPLGSLHSLAAWEHQALSHISSKLVDLSSKVHNDGTIQSAASGQDKSVRDQADLAALALAVQRGSLSSALSSLLRILAREPTKPSRLELDPILEQLFQRLAAVEISVPLDVDTALSKDGVALAQIHVRCAEVTANKTLGAEIVSHNSWQMAGRPNSSSSRRLRAGDLVRLAAGAEANPVLEPGEIGRIYFDDFGVRPFRVVGPRGASDFWFSESSLVHVSLEEYGSDGQTRGSPRAALGSPPGSPQCKAMNLLKADVIPEEPRARPFPTSSRDSFAVSPDGRFIYLCGESIGGILKVGTGNATFSANATVEGQVYARISLARWTGTSCQDTRQTTLTWTACIADKVLLFTRRAGSLFLTTEMFSADTLAREPNTGSSRHRLAIAQTAAREQYAVVHGSDMIEVQAAKCNRVVLALKSAHRGTSGQVRSTHLAAHAMAAAVAWCGSGSTWLNNSGSWYFEVEISRPGPIAVGWANPTFFNQAALEEVSSAWLFFTHSATAVDENGVSRNWGQVCKAGDVIGCALTFDAHNQKAIMSFSRNGEWKSPMGAAFEIDTPVLFVRPVVTLAPSAALSHSITGRAAGESVIGATAIDIAGDEPVSAGVASIASSVAGGSPGDLSDETRELPAAIVCCGGIKEEDADRPLGHYRFRFCPPSDGFVPVAWNSGCASNGDQDEDEDVRDGDDCQGEEEKGSLGEPSVELFDDYCDVRSGDFADCLGPLPPLATDGRFVYCAQAVHSILPTNDGDADAGNTDQLERELELVIDVLDPLENLSLVRRVRIQSRTAPSAFPAFSDFFSWHMFTNGNDLVIVHDSEVLMDPETKVVKRKVGSVCLNWRAKSESAPYWRWKGWPASPVSGGPSITQADPSRPAPRLAALDSHENVLTGPDAFAFCPVHNVLWEWRGVHNTLLMHPNAGFAGPQPEQGATEDSLSSSFVADGEALSRVEFAAKLLSTIARLGSPFLPPQPISGVFGATLSRALEGQSPECMTAGELFRRHYDGHGVPTDIFMDPQSEVLDMLFGLIQSFESHRKEDANARHATALIDGINACLRLILLNCCLHDGGVPRRSASFRKELLRFCVATAGDQDSDKCTKRLCVHLVLQCPHLFLQDAEELAEFLSTHLEALAKSSQKLTAEFSQLIGGLLQSFSALLILRPFHEQVQLSHNLLSSLFEVVDAHVRGKIAAVKNCAIDEPGSQQDGHSASDLSSDLCDAASSVLLTLTTSGLCLATSDPSHASVEQVFKIFSLVTQQSSKVLLASCDVAQELSKFPISSHEASRQKANLMDAVRSGLVGRVSPWLCAWTEFLLRSKLDRSKVATVLLHADPGLESLTSFLGCMVKFCSVVASPEERHVPRCYGSSETLGAKGGSGGSELPNEAASHSRRRGSTIVTAAAIAGAQQTSRTHSECSRFVWSRSYTVEQTFESPHPYLNNMLDRWQIHIPGAQYLVIRFDPRTSTEEQRDFLRFLRTTPGRPNAPQSRSEYMTEDDRFGEDSYSGRSGSHWPGVGQVPPLVIPCDRCDVTFSSDGSEVDWGFKFTVQAHVSEVHEVVCNPWHVHLSAICRDMVSSVVYATIGNAMPLPEIEARQLRWIQNPILSGGLKEEHFPQSQLDRVVQLTSPSSKHYGADGPAATPGSNTGHPNSAGMPPLPPSSSHGLQYGSAHAKRTRSRARTNSQSRGKSMSEEDRGAAEEMLLDMLSDTIPQPNLGGALFKALREQRVPLDQGFFTHRLAAAVGAALIRINGLEREALRLARSTANRPAGRPPTADEAPSAKLLKIWTLAQYTRSWADQLVVNGQVQHHIEACLPTGSSLQLRLLDQLSRPTEFDDPEEPQYAALGEVVASRARFLILEVAPPISRMMSLRSERQDAARARWHRLRRHFCPVTQRMLQQKKRWEVLLGAVRAMTSLRSMVEVHRSAAQKMASSLSRSRFPRQASADFSTGDYSRDRSVSRERTFSRDSFDDMSRIAESPQLGRATLGIGPISSFDSPTSASTPHHTLLSARSATSMSSSTSGSSHFSFQGPHRRRERLSGGLRRTSISEADSDLDIVAQEHDQSLSESVNTFVQAAVPLDSESLRDALIGRNERAVTRVAGFEFVNTVITLARAQQRYSDARALFDVVLFSAARAMRGTDNSHGLGASAGYKICDAIVSDAHRAGDTLATLALSVSAQSEVYFTTSAQTAASSQHASQVRGDIQATGIAQDEEPNIVRSEPAETSQTVLLESHYLADLPGCSASLRELVGVKFLGFLRNLSALIELTVRQHASATKAARDEEIGSSQQGAPMDTAQFKKNLNALEEQLKVHVQRFVQVVSLDFVESDFELLASSGLVQAIRTILFHDFGQSASGRRVRSMGWACFELLLRRCICESGCEGAKLTKRLASGSSLQQALLDVLVALLEEALVATPGTSESSTSVPSAARREGEAFILQPGGPGFDFDAAHAALIGGPVELGKDCTFSFVLGVREERFAAGRLFSFGNPQAQADAAGISQAVASSSQKFLAASVRRKLAWIQIGLDTLRRLVITFGDLAGLALTLVSDYALPGDAVCSINVAILEANSVELHVVSEFPAGPDQTAHRVYTVEEFPGILFELGQAMPSPMGRARPSAKAKGFKVAQGSYVRVCDGVFTGYTGLVVSTSATAASVCLQMAPLGGKLEPGIPKFHTTSVDISSLRLVLHGTPPLKSKPSAQVREAVLSSLEFDLDPNDTSGEKGLVLALSDLGLDDGSIKAALECHRNSRELLEQLSRSPEVPVQELSSSFGFPSPVDDQLAYTLSAPLYIGECPSWGNGPHHQTASGVHLHSLSVQPSAALGISTVSNLAPSRTVSSVVFAEPPNAVDGGVQLIDPRTNDLGGTASEAVDLTDSTLLDGDWDDAASTTGTVSVQHAFWRRAEEETTEALKILSLAHAACVSSVGRARLTAPFPIGLLLRTCIVSSTSIELRVAAAKVLGNLLLDVAPSEASAYALQVTGEHGPEPVDGKDNNYFLHLILGCIASSMHPVREIPNTSSSLRQSSTDAAAVSMALVDLLHSLCASEAWVSCLATWLAAALEDTAESLEAQVRGGGDAGVTGLSNKGLAALAILGGVYESPRIGGRAVSTLNSGLLSKSEVAVLGRLHPNRAISGITDRTLAPGSGDQLNAPPVDVTSTCKVQASTTRQGARQISATAVLDESSNVWESSGYAPHWLQVTVPAGHALSAVSILTNQAFNNFSPERVELRVGSCAEDLRTIRALKLPQSTKWVSLIQAEDVRPTDSVFRLEILSNHYVGCDTRVQQLRIMAVRADQSRATKRTATCDKFLVYPLYGTGDEASGGAPNGSGVLEVDGSSLTPLRSSPPPELLEGLSEQIVLPLQRILRSDPDDLSGVDLKARAAMVVCNLLQSQRHMETIGAALLPLFLRESRARPTATPVSVRSAEWRLASSAAQALRISTESFSGPVDSDADDSTSSVTFSAAGKVHRLVALDVPPMITGRHFWECKVVSDTRDDETSVLGIISLAGADSMGKSSSTGTVENLLRPTADLWLIQCFNGARLHKGLSPQWDGSRSVKVHPGDVVRFLLDMDTGSLSVAVNSNPFTRVFFGIDKEALWGVLPCVGTYGNHADVQIELGALRTSQSPGVHLPQKHLLLSGSSDNLESRAARLSQLLYEGTAMINSEDQLVVDWGGRNTPRREPPGVWDRQILNLSDTFETEESDCSSDSELDEPSSSQDRESSPVHRTSPVAEHLHSNHQSGSRADLERSHSGPAFSGAVAQASSSQLLIQKINALYEVAESSSEQDNRRTVSRNEADNARREQEIQALSLAILSDPGFVTNGRWLLASSMEVFHSMYQRASERALESLVVNWSACTAHALPPYMLEPDALNKTVNLIFRNCSGGSSIRAAEAIAYLCKSNEGMGATLLELCAGTFGVVGQRLSNMVRSFREHSRQHHTDRRTEERDAATARAQIEAAHASISVSTQPFAGAHAPSERDQRHESTPRESLQDLRSRMIGGSRRDMDPELRGSGGPDTFKIGDRVFARFMGGRRFYPGVIAKIYTDGTFAVDYDDGDKESHVPSQLISLDDGRASAATPSTPRTGMQVGDAVQARFRRGHQWFDGRITKVHEGGAHFDIQYDDGDFEQLVPTRYVRRHQVVPPGQAPPPSAILGRHRAAVARQAAPQTSADPSRRSREQSQSITSSVLDEGLTGDETYMLIADRYRGDIPPSGKADSAQVSIINSPASADGVVQSVRLRLAEPPAGGVGSWDVLVFERAGDTSTFFVVEGTPTQPTRSSIHFDPGCVDLQTVPLQNKVHISQGQYLGVINPRGRLNVAYTPGKKKIEESWALKPVEVFYLMPKNVPDPFVSGPHRTRLWHGRAGWCATMLVANSSGTGETPRFLRYHAEELFGSIMSSGITVEEAVRQASWLLHILVKEQFINALDVLAVPGFVNALRRIHQYGVFCIDGDSLDREEITSQLYDTWLPLVEMITGMCTKVAEDIELAGPPREPLPRQETTALILLQAAIEGKVEDMNKRRQKRLRDLAKSKSGIASGDSAARASAEASATGAEVMAAMAGVRHQASGHVRSPAQNNNISSSSNNNNNNNNNARLPNQSSDAQDGPPSNGIAVAPGSDRQRPVLAPISTSGNDNRQRGDQSAHSPDNENNENAGEGYSGIRFQRLLKCLVAIDDLTRKDGLNGEVLLVDSPRRTRNEEAEWEDFQVTLVAQDLMTPAVVTFEFHNGRLCVADVRTTAAGIGDSGEMRNIEVLSSALEVGDELIAVEDMFLESQAEADRELLTSVAICGPRFSEIHGSSRSESPAVNAGTDCDFSVPYLCNGVLFPPLEGAFPGFVGSGVQLDSKSLASRTTAISCQSEMELTFRRRHGTSTFVQQLRAGTGISYRGVQGCLPNKAYASSEMAQSSVSLDHAEWLNSLVTATELLRAFASRSLPPQRYMKEQFSIWCEREKQCVVESVHPVIANLPWFSESPPDRPAPATAPAEHGHIVRGLARQRTHSRAGDDDELPVFSNGPDLAYPGGVRRANLESQRRGLPPRAPHDTRHGTLLGELPRSALARTRVDSAGSTSSSSSPTISASSYDSSGRGGAVINAGSMQVLNEQTVYIPGATALRLQWDSRSLLFKGRDDLAIVVEICGRRLVGRNGLPPTLSVVSGSTFKISVESRLTRHDGQQLPRADTLAGANRDVAVAGLQNRAGVYVWLGTKPMFRARFYCGRNWSDIVGWSEAHGFCGPFGDQQCPDCAAVLPLNMAGLPMTSGFSRIPSAKERFKDLLYCERCRSPPVPCADCRQFMAVMKQTASLSRVPYRKRSHFDSDLAYARFLASVVVPGMQLRLMYSSRRYAVKSGAICTLLALRSDLSCKVSIRYGAGRPTLEVPLYHLELLTVREAGGQDNRSVLTSPARSVTDSGAGSRRSGTGFEEAIDELEDDAEALMLDHSATIRYLEATDFSSPREYARYMSRNCHKGDKVRCSKAYESVAEGDVGEVIRIDEGDDLPCQVLWVNLGAQYWLPWECLSLNLQRFNRSVNTLPPAGRASYGAESAGYGQPPVGQADVPSITFATDIVGPGTEIFNGNRSVTRSSRHGFGTQRLSRVADAAVGKMNATFSVDGAVGSKLYFGVISVNGGFGGEDNELEGETPMSETGAWALRADGALFVDGVEVRGRTPSKAIHLGDLITVSIDIGSKSRSVTFLKHGEVLDTVIGLPNRVVPAVSLSSSFQRVSVRRVEVGQSVAFVPIEGWGYRLLVEPAFDSTRLSSDDANQVGTGNEIDQQYASYLARQKSWTKREDELLIGFVNEAVMDSDISLSQLTRLGWDDLLTQSSARLSDKAQVHGARTAASEANEPSEGEVMRSEGEVMRQDSKPPLDCEPGGPSRFALDGAECLLALIIERANKVTSDLIPTVESRSAGPDPARAVSALRAIDGADQLDSGGVDVIEVGEFLRLKSSALASVVEDVAQRFNLLRALNASAHDALGLLDLTAWKDPGSTAAHLSECCGLILDKFKLPLWTDAISSTKAEDIHRFEVVLDFGRAMSRRHIADIHGRHTVFAQAFRAMHPMAAKTLRAHGKLYKCVMRGMASHDDGGPYRQSFSEYCNELQTLPGVGLLLPCSNRANQIRVNRDRWLPNPTAVSPVQISMFEFLGKLMGIAIRNTELLDLRLPSLVWKPLVNQIPTVDDLRAVDVLTVSSADPHHVDPASFLAAQDLRFTVVTLDGREVELIPNGRHLPVDVGNYSEWAQRTLDYKIHEFDTQVEAIRRGLASIIPQRLLVLFRWDELELLVCGQPRVDLELLKRMTVYSDCCESDRHIQFFWQALESFSEEQRSGYIKFVWGRARLPLDKESWEQPHKVAVFHPPRPGFGKPQPSIDSLLPYAHTCYFTIDIPKYTSAEVMRKRLLYAIENCPEIDGDQTTTGRRAAAMGFDISDSDDEDNSEAALELSEDTEEGDLLPSPPPALISSGGVTPAPPLPTLPQGSPTLRLDTIAESSDSSSRQLFAGLLGGTTSSREAGTNTTHDVAVGPSSPHGLRARGGRSRGVTQLSLSQLLSRSNVAEDPFSEYSEFLGELS